MFLIYLPIIGKAQHLARRIKALAQNADDRRLHAADGQGACPRASAMASNSGHRGHPY
jgi:hypothetical protein